MSKLCKRVIAGMIVALVACGAAIAVSPPLELDLVVPTATIPPAVDTNGNTPKCSAADCCKDGPCQDACCKAGCCKNETRNCTVAACCSKGGECTKSCCAKGCCSTTKSVGTATMGVSLEWSGPPAARVGKPGEYTLTARNVCGKPVQRVTVQVKVPCCADVTAVMPAGKEVDGVYVWDLGTMDPGEAVPLTLAISSPRKGDLACEAWITCTGTAAVVVPVREPKLEVVVAAPRRVVIGNKYNVEYTVTNVGDVAAESVQCSRHTDKTPADDSNVIHQLPPGESRTVTAEFRAGTAGETTHTLTAATADGLYATTAAHTVVEGVPALRMQVVDLTDPVEKGGDTTYEIRVVNTGTAADSNVTVTCPLPGQLKLTAATGPTGVTAQQLNTLTLVRFEPIRELAPKTEAVFRVTVKTVATGDVRFTAQMTSANLTTSVTKEESTRVYGD